MNQYHGYKDLIVYQKAFVLSNKIFTLTQTFPKEELYSLTDQIRRSSRSIGANITESWPKRRYPKSFIAKLVDSQSETCETQHWLDVALSLKYMNARQYDELTLLCKEIQKMLDSMIQTPLKFCRTPCDAADK